MEQRQEREPGEPKAPKQASMPPRRIWVAFLVALLANFLVMRLFFPARRHDHRALHRLQGAGRQAQRRVDLQPGREHRGPLRGAGHVAAREAGSRREGGADGGAGARRIPAQPAPRTASNFTTTLPAFVDPGLEDFLIEHGVEISAVPIQSGRGWTTLLYGFGPAILLIAFYVWMFRRAERRHGRRADGHRPQQGAPLRPGAGRAGHVRRRRGHRRGRERAGRDRRLPARPAASTRGWAARRPRACCWSARREPARRCSRRPSRARRACRSSR